MTMIGSSLTAPLPPITSAEEPITVDFTDPFWLTRFDSFAPFAVVDGLAPEVPADSDGHLTSLNVEGQFDGLSLGLSTSASV